MVKVDHKGLWYIVNIMHSKNSFRAWDWSSKALHESLPCTILQNIFIRTPHNMKKIFILYAPCWTLRYTTNWTLYMGKRNGQYHGFCTNIMQRFLDLQTTNFPREITSGWAYWVIVYSAATASWPSPEHLKPQTNSWLATLTKSLMRPGMVSPLVKQWAQDWGL